MGVVMGVIHIGQRCDEGGVGTVRMGRRVVEDIGGSTRCGLESDAAVDRAFSEASACCEGARLLEGGREGNMGGGRSIFSAALRDS